MRSLDEIQEFHHRRDILGEQDSCRCGQRMPCDAVVLLAALRASAEPALSPSLRSRVNSANGGREVVQAAKAWRAAYRAVTDATSREYPGDTDDAAPRWVEGMTRASVEYSTAEDALGAAVDAYLAREGRGG